MPCIRPCFPFTFPLSSPPFFFPPFPLSSPPFFFPFSFPLSPPFRLPLSSLNLPFVLRQSSWLALWSSSKRRERLRIGGACCGAGIFTAETAFASVAASVNTAHVGPEQFKIQTEVLGHSLVRLLVRLLRTACANRCAHSLARSLTSLTPSLMGQ